MTGDPQRASVKVSGHMLCGAAETDGSSDDSSCDVLELEMDQGREEPTTASVTNSDCEGVALHVVDAEHSKEEPGGFVPLEMVGRVKVDTLLSHTAFGSSPLAALRESSGDGGEHSINSASGPNDITSAQDTAEMGIDRQDADNAFGISYRPHGSTMKRGYNLPSGLAFVDEDEFERELSAEFRVAAGSSGQAGARRTTSFEPRQQCRKCVEVVYPGREKDDGDFFEESAADVCHSRAVRSTIS